MRRIAYIHDHAEWPHLTWDAGALSPALAAVRHKQGLLLGRLESIGFDLRAEATVGVLTSDVVKTSAIEGETLDAMEVRSSIARRLGLDAGGLPRAGRDVEAIVEVLLDATQKYPEPLTRERLFAWHGALFPTGRSGLYTITVGAWRTAESGAMQVISGPIGRERVHFEAPHADLLEQEMSRFLAWFNGPPVDDPVLRAGIAHLWFVTVHPFSDGNGRIARAIADMQLSRADGSGQRFYSMSTQIESERSEYYRQLERQQKGSTDITGWLSWFLGCLERAIDGADVLSLNVFRKARVWRRINLSGTINERQRRVINMLLDGFEGSLTSSKYAKLTKCSPDTALRDIQDLVAREVLAQNPGSGRSTSYRLVDVDEPAEPSK